MRITVVGGGYVGLTTGICFSHLGYEVKVVEKVPQKVSMLNEGVVPIYEPGLEDMLKDSLRLKRISFTTDLVEGLEFSEVIFICVGTPQQEDGSADLSQVEEVARLTAEHMESYKLLVEKSTVPVNTHKLIKKTLQRYMKRHVEFDVASNPEFLREGSAVKDFLEPDRIVVGIESERAKNLLQKLYEPIKAPILFTDPATAELIKHASNSFLAMKISFINMISDLCEKTGADVKLVADGMGYDKRIGRAFLDAGIGWGGSCFPKDVRAFIKMAEDYGVDFSLLREVDKINARRIENFLEKVKNALWSLKNKKLAVWGLSFKPNTDDIREAPSIKIVSALLREGAKLQLYDPKAMGNFRRIFPEGEDLIYAQGMYEAIKGCDALLILTEWEEFKKADLERVKHLLKLPVVIDGRNIYEPAHMRELGFEYYCMGRR
ncbi:nucleotide sugar dehydrogenase [Hydrogenobacter thermophilus TK-6]|uniref:UDP-glucose 6-dehydrogenase n=1 Tax=Hydrogenobacter thermophilus (strain DSM 6534 / IAM 12695 / TK-6) TaxID=608538 RepID=D3DG80_HYDTT|nr:UDP-glucose/GDP-mannose dehydrogenase family protein [Hydrogenobacter thermophilus]ADO44767.1 nucleotide sugar dehydrogenase [Hydrogenobacter thermophilus TK-6]BAI68832.1 UDP-glucose 6-dehydrogenase [Hydrogenobacter thermophilus TK-6]